jgi:hypothetical protein
MHKLNSLGARLMAALLAAVTLFLPACIDGKLTPQAAAALTALDGPLCAGAAGAITAADTSATGPVAVLLGSAGVVCQESLAALIAEETAPAGAVGSSTTRKLRVTATPGCKPELIPGDARR